MQRTNHFRWLGLVGLALLPLGLAACSPAEQDRTQQTTDSVAGEVKQSGEEINHSLSSLGDEARQRTQQLGDQLRDASRDVREAAARNGVSQVMAGEFQRHSVTLDGTPTCSATSEQMGQYHVECTAKTTDGRTATLTGDDPGEGASDFVGKVDGTEVFRQECVGLC